MSKNKTKIEKLAIVLVSLMTLLQAFYAFYGFLEPVSFAYLRGTELIASADLDWVQIYASRTLFVALIIGYLLYMKDYRSLMWAALFGIVMPVTDGILAFEAQAPMKVVFKHIATMVYLLAIALVLKRVVKSK